MNLQHFVTSSLEQIFRGILDAERKVCDTGGIICPGRQNPDGSVAYLEKRIDREHSVYVHNVHFDVAVTVSAKGEDSGGAGIEVLGLNIGGKARHEDENQTVSRIVFDVPVTFPLANYRGPLADQSSTPGIGQRTPPTCRHG